MSGESSSKARTALVTGASSGIGETFARELARRGFDLYLTARRGDLLETLATELRERHGGSVAIVAADLGRPEGIAKVVEATKDVEIDLLVNNAGFGTHGRFAEIDPARLQAEIALNVAAPTALARAFIPAMIARGHGGIINVSSTAAYQPVAGMASYGATKAFMLSLSEALWAECRGTGVKVLALSPGATKTRFFDVAGEGSGDRFPQRDTPEEVVRIGLKALAQDRPSVIVGRRNAFFAISTRFATRRAVALISRRMSGLD